MQSLLRATAVIAIILWPLSLRAQVSNGDCPRVQNETPIEALNDLKQNVFSRAAEPEAWCIRQAVRRTRLLKPELSEATLLRYLDFPDPKFGFGHTTFLSRNEDRISTYPAVLEFVRHGKVAVPTLTDLIGADQSSPLMRQNASIAIANILLLNPPDMAEYLDKEGDRAGPGIGRNFHETASQIRELAARGHDGWGNSSFYFRTPPSDAPK